jgi:Domain of unknown function (DUF1877)
MSVLCSLTQISSDLLLKIREMPSVLELFRVIEPIDSEERKIDNVYGLSSEHNYLLSEILSEPEQAIGQLTLRDLEEVELWKGEYPDDYQSLKSEVYQILTEGKRTPILDLMKGWDAVGYIFRGDTYSESQSFLANGSNEETRIEVIFGGKSLDEDTRYLESAEVQEIASALCRFSENIIRKRFEQGRNMQPTLYHWDWLEESYGYLLNRCVEVQNFYTDAAEQAKGILISLG